MDYQAFTNESLTLVGLTNRPDLSHSPTAQNTIVQGDILEYERYA